jgi:hypothetical protein
MKTSKFFLAFVIVLTLCLFNCKKTVEELSTINAPAVKTAFVVQIFDAATQELIGMKSGQEIKVTILGTDKNLVSDIFGRSVTSLSTHQGIISLSIAGTTTPSADNPVDFVVDLSCDGYLHGSLPIRIASEGGHSFIARLVDPKNPPEGVSVFEGVVGRTLIDGTLENKIDVSTPPVQQTMATTHVVIAEGTKILDESGTPLSGDLTFLIAYYSNQSPIALDCFPGSFCVKTDEGGMQGKGLFFSGGWADYELSDQSGRVAKSFSKPISLTIDVPPNTYNPETKAKIKTGDYYPIWNYRYSDGVWEYENEGLLQGPSGNGNYYVEYQASHFSLKNVDWYTWNDILMITEYLMFKSSLANSQFQVGRRYLKNLPFGNKSITVTTDSIDIPNISIARVIFKEQTTGFIYWSSGYLESLGDNFYIPDGPCKLPTEIEVWGGCPYSKLGSILVDNICDEDSFSIPLKFTKQPAGQIMNVDFSLTVNCEFARLRPNISAFYDDGCGWKYIGQVINGHITVPGLETGKGYSFGVWLEDKWFDEFYTIDKTSYTWSIDLPESVCNKY